MLVLEWLGGGVEALYRLNRIVETAGNISWCGNTMHTTSRRWTRIPLTTRAHNLRETKADD